VNTRRASVALVATFCLVAAACSSSSKSHNSTGSNSQANSAGKGQTITIGVLTDLTGAAASTGKTVLPGIKAGIYQAKQEGFNINYQVADTTSTPAGVLTAAQELVDQDHAAAIYSGSALTFAAAPFLTSKNIPVIGVAQDGPEWLTSANMFPVTGYLVPTQPSTTTGNYMKSQGVTNAGIMGYSLAQSANAAKSDAVSVRNAGLKVGYLNTTFPLGSTNVAPSVLAMKQAGIDGFVGPLAPATAIALVEALHQQGVDLKASFLSSGGGGDLTSSGSAGMTEAQGITFGNPYEPVEMNTSATKQLQTALTAVGVTGDPTFSEYNAYNGMLLLARAMQGASSDLSSAGLVTSLSKITDWDAAGLWGGNIHVDYANRASSESSVGVDNCEWMTKVQGSSFVLVSGADPICGAFISGSSTSSTS
jgi:ABC-type branched-subunit amino acid transport system substrate-binding protein